MSDFNQKMRDAEDQMYEDIKSHRKVKRVSEDDHYLRLWVESYANADVLGDVERHSGLRFGNMKIEDGLIKMNCRKL